MRRNDYLIEKSKILEIIVSKVERDLFQDVAIVVCYGSFVTGKQHRYSDIDFFFIPKTKKGLQLSFQFIIDGIGYDFWPITWERIRNISELNDQLESILLEGKILFYSSKDDLERFETFVGKTRRNLTKQDQKEKTYTEDAASNEHSPQTVDPSMLNGFYEELKSIYNKVKFACEEQDLQSTEYAARIIDDGIESLVKPFLKDKEFPTLRLVCKSKNFSLILEELAIHEHLLLEVLRDLNIKLNIYKDVNEFEHVFNKLGEQIE